MQTFSYFHDKFRLDIIKIIMQRLKTNLSTIMQVSERVSLKYDLPLQVFILLEFAQKRKNEQCVYGAFVLHVVINLALLSSFHKLSRCSKTKTFHSFHRIGFFFYLSFLIVIICTCRVACIRLREFLRFLCFKASSNFPQKSF